MPKKHLVEKRCNCCFEVKPLSMFSGGDKKNFYCKPCACTHTYRRLMEKRLEKNPEIYFECDDCDHIFKNFDRRTKKPVRKCGKCGSSNYIDYTRVIL